jgi:hypothetical protein
MNKFIKATSVLSIAFITVLSSCKKKDDPLIVDPGPTMGSVHLEFFNRVGDDPMSLGLAQYFNANGDQYAITKFNYFITNIKLNKQDGSQYIEENSYHLVKQTESGSQTFDLAQVPNGTYKSITFMIGVDSARNTSGAQTGALDDGNDMYWDWNTGYIMVKMEGTSTSSTQPGNVLQFHIGGFSGANSVLRTVTLTFPNNGDLVVNGNEPHMHIKADINKLFSGANEIDFATLSAVHMPGANAKKIADNYQQMFSVTAIGE